MAEDKKKAAAKPIQKSTPSTPGTQAKKPAESQATNKYGSKPQK